LENETADLSVKGPGPTPLTPTITSSGNNPDDDFLAPLPTLVKIPDNLVSGWSIDPNHGTISGSGNSATYLAPASIKAIEKITVSCNVKIKNVLKVDKWMKPNAKNRWTGHLPDDYKTLHTFLTIRPTNLKFNFKMEYHNTHTSDVFDDHYSDMVEMEVDVNGYTVSIPTSSIKNYPPSVPDSVGDDGTTRASWIRDMYGEINTVSATADFSWVDSTKKYIILMQFNGQNQQYPKWHWVIIQTGASPGDAGGGALPNNSWSDISFPLVNNSTIIGIGNSKQYFRYTIDPIQ
jgi:hypothetical protein